MTTPDATVVLTIGHSNHPWTLFRDVLREHGVQRLVDVRSAPYSRFAPQFNREALAAELEAVGIAYGYAGDYLGGRPTDPTCYFNRSLPEGKANYLELVDYREVAQREWFKRGLDRVVERARESTTAILCSEEDPARCHRHHLIARELRQRGVEVRHIRAEAPLEFPSETDDRIERERGGQQAGLFDALEAS